MIELKWYGIFSQVSSTTVTLIVVSVVFLFLNLPSDVFFIGYASKPTATTKEYADQWLFHDVVNFLAYASNSINFFMYFVSGRKFRQAAWDVICCRCFRNRLRQKNAKSAMQVHEVNEAKERRSTSTTDSESDESRRTSVSTVTEVTTTPRPSLTSELPIAVEYSLMGNTLWQVYVRSKHHFVW